MATAKIGHGSELWIANDTNVLTKVAELTSVGLPNPQVAEVEATHFESPDRSREYIPGLKDNGEIAFGINWLPGSVTDELINSALNDDQARDMEVRVPGTGDTKQVFAFAGIVRGYEKAIPIDDRMTATVTVRVSGAVTQEAAGA